jgi:hypothetical protein
MTSPKIHDQRLKPIDPPNWTMTPNVIHDEWVKKIDHPPTMLLIFILCRHTFGWHKDSVELSISQLEEMSALCRRTVIDALKRAGPDGWDVIERIPSGQSYRYRLKIRAGLQLVKPKPITILCEEEPETSAANAPVLNPPTSAANAPVTSARDAPPTSAANALLLKINRVKKTHTKKGTDSGGSSQNDTPENRAEVYVSEFSREEIKEYAAHQKTLLGVGWIVKALDTGKWDEDIADWFEQELKKHSTHPTGLTPVTPPDLNCTICHGSGKYKDQACACTVCRKCNGTGMEVVDGKGARKCECRTKTREFRRTG